MTVELVLRWTGAYAGAQCAGGAGKLSDPAQAQDVSLLLRLMVPKHKLLQYKVRRQLLLLHVEARRGRKMDVCPSFYIFDAELHSASYDTVVLGREIKGAGGR
jgi:hypothetical protein